MWMATVCFINLKKSSAEKAVNANDYVFMSGQPNYDSSQRVLNSGVYASLTLYYQYEVHTLIKMTQTNASAREIFLKITGKYCKIMYISQIYIRMTRYRYSYKVSRRLIRLYSNLNLLLPKKTIGKLMTAMIVLNY